MKSRRGFAIQRLMNAMRQAHADGWFIVFDTLTLADDRLEAFYDNPNALRDYFRDIGRMVLAAEGRKANDSHADCYQYFCVPEYGTANGRLHFHAVHFFFFSSRRRHTSCSRDWSSDVCSSDLCRTACFRHQPFEAAFPRTRVYWRMRKHAVRHRLPAWRHFDFAAGQDGGNHEYGCGRPDRKSVV